MILPTMKVSEVSCSEVKGNSMQRQASLTALLLSLPVLLLAGSVTASGVFEVAGFEEVAWHVDSLTAVYGAEEVLLVFDIDNTLLVSDRSLGTPSWFTWQDSLINVNSDSPFRAAEDFSGLLDLQGLIYFLGRMHLTEELLPQLINQWHDDGHSTLVLTSREPTFNDATQRELSEAGFSFAAGQPGVDPEFRGVHLPYSMDELLLCGLTEEEFTGFGLNAPREIRYEDGVLMVAGQHKGAMLLILLAHCPEYFPAVVFVDDSHENVERVFDALEGRGIDINAFRYGAEDSMVEAFDLEEKLQTFEHLEDIEAALELVFPEVNR